MSFEKMKWRYSFGFLEPRNCIECRKLITEGMHRPKYPCELQVCCMECWKSTNKLEARSAIEDYAYGR